MVFALVALPASAYTLIGFDWTWQDHPIEDPFTIFAGEFPSDMGDTGEIAAAFTNAMGTWNDVGRDVTLTDGGLATASALAADGYPIIQYGSYAGLGGALAFAATWSYDDGLAFDCDVFVLSSSDAGAIYWDADPAGPASGRYDMEAVALHELGHCLGLDHSADATAVMYAYYGGLRALHADDEAGLASMYAPACADLDGDGAFGCDTDCDDANALVFPGAVEVCDGADGDCDGLVDASATETVDFTNPSTAFASAWIGVGNAFVVNAPTALVSARVYYEVAAGTRLVWSVYTSTDAGATWSPVRTQIAFATADTRQQSPDLHVPLTVGSWYSVNLGGYADPAIVKYDASPDLSAGELITPLGAVYGRPMADDLTTVDATYLFDAEIVLVSTADADGDGQTALCGDCAPDDAAISSAAAEACDGIDQDCDGQIDEDFAVDADGDNVFDCLDPCPLDAADTCDDPVDTSTDTSIDTGGDTDSAGDTDSGGDTDTAVDTDEAPDDKPAEPPGGCGCASGASAPALLGLLPLLLVRRRRPG